MVILVLSIVILVLIIMLVLLFKFCFWQSKKCIALVETLDVLTKCYDDIISLYDKYRAAETNADKAKFVKAILDVAQDANIEYYRKLKEYKENNK